MPRTHNPFPDPVCRHPDEYGFVAAVLASPLDDLPKLVYADWLDEHSDPRGLFLRQWLAARQAGKKLPKPDKALSKCWLSVMGYTLDAWLVKQGYPAWADAIRATAEPGLIVRTVRLNDGETVPTGRSKMGGLPDLLPDDEWPVCNDELAGFVAQWNLSELAVSPCCARLPKQGLFSFFIDLVPFVEDSGDGFSRVVFNRDASTAEETEPEDDLHEYNDLPACRVEFREWLSIPEDRSPVLRKRLSEGSRDDYALAYFGYPKPKGSHRILGHVSPIHNHPTPSGSRKEWSLLTQFGPDDAPNLEACDGGTWYFMIPATDLKKGKISGTHMEFQSG